MESHKIPWFQSPPTSYTISQIWASSWRKIGTLQQWQDPHFSQLFWVPWGTSKGWAWRGTCLLLRYASQVDVDRGHGVFLFVGRIGHLEYSILSTGKKRTSISASITMGWSKVEMTNQHSEGAPLALTICLELHLSQNKCSTWNLLALVKGVRAKVEQKIYKGTFSQCPCKHLSMGLCKRNAGWALLFAQGCRHGTAWVCIRG